MNYRLIRNTRNLSRRYGIAYPLLVLVLIVLFHTLFPHALSSLASYLARPLWKAEVSAVESIGGIFQLFSSKRELLDTITRQNAELQEKDALLLDRNALAAENSVLKASFGREEQDSGLLAVVLTTPPRSLYDTVVLDIGSAEGVSTGMLIFSGPVAIGTVARTEAHTSLGELFSTPGRITPMRIRHDGVVIPVEAEGQGGGAFVVTLPKETPVSVGDDVLLPSLSPKLFGKVDAVDSSLSSSFETVRILSPISPSSLYFVKIVPLEAGFELP